MALVAVAIAVAAGPPYVFSLGDSARFSNANGQGPETLPVSGDPSRDAGVFSDSGRVVAYGIIARVSGPGVKPLHCLSSGPAGVSTPACGSTRW